MIDLQGEIFLSACKQAFGFRRISLRRTLNLNVTFIRYAPLPEPSIIPNPDSKVQGRSPHCATRGPIGLHVLVRALSSNLNDLLLGP